METKRINLIDKPEIAVKDADVIITDAWESMGIKKNESHLKMFSEYQVNKKLMSKTNKKLYSCIVLPAHRGCEVTNEVMDGDNSLVWDEAQNRLYAHQSILLYGV